MPFIHKYVFGALLQPYLRKCGCKKASRHRQAGMIGETQSTYSFLELLPPAMLLRLHSTQKWPCRLEGGGATMTANDCLAYGVFRMADVDYFFDVVCCWLRGGGKIK
jgi:hypothetical protein